MSENLSCFIFLGGDDIILMKLDSDFNLIDGFRYGF